MRELIPEWETSTWRPAHITGKGQLFWAKQLVRTRPWNRLKQNILRGCERVLMIYWGKDVWAAQLSESEKMLDRRVGVNYHSSGLEKEKRCHKRWLPPALNLWTGVWIRSQIQIQFILNNQQPTKQTEMESLPWEFNICRRSLPLLSAFDPTKTFTGCFNAKKKNLFVNWQSSLTDTKILAQQLKQYKNFVLKAEQ